MILVDSMHFLPHTHIHLWFNSGSYIRWSINIVIYHSSDCLSDRNQLEPLGSDRKLVGNNSEWSDRNPVGQIRQIPYYLGGTVFQNFRSESEWFRLIPLGKRGAQTRPRYNICFWWFLATEYQGSSTFRSIFWAYRTDTGLLVVHIRRQR